MLSPQPLHPPILSKRKRCMALLFCSLLFRAFSFIWTRSYGNKACVFWRLLNAKYCLASSSFAISVTSSKFSSCTEFNIFDLEKSSLPGEMTLLVEFFTSREHSATQKDPDMIFCKFHWLWELWMSSYVCLKEQFQKCF